MEPSPDTEKLTEQEGEESEEDIQICEGSAPYRYPACEEQLDPVIAMLPNPDGPAIPFELGGMLPKETYYSTMVQKAKEQLEPNELAYLKTCSVMICTPAYGAQVSIYYVQSLIQTLFVLNGLGVECEPAFFGTESLISRARNAFVAHFLGSTHTHLLFIDADIGFKPGAVLRLLLSRRKLVAGVYPIKAYQWEMLIGYIRRHPLQNPIDVETMKQICALYPINMKAKVTKDDMHNGFMQVKEAATGFMLISRDLLMLLTQKFPDKAYINDCVSYKNKRTQGNFYAFFQPQIAEDGSRRYLSEDYSFCHLCAKVGIFPWVDLMMPFTHTGIETHVGKAMAQFAALHALHMRHESH